MELTTCLVYLLLTAVNCDKKEEIPRKNRLPYFIRLVKTSEELNLEGPQVDDQKPNLVSLLVKNVREVFSDIYTTDVDSYLYSNTTFPSDILRSKVNKTSRGIAEDNKLTDIATEYENISLGNLINTKLLQQVVINENELIEKQIPLLLAKTMRPVEVPNTSTAIIPFVLHSTEFGDTNYTGRSCIFCNNVMYEDCNDPKNKLIPSILCDRDGDLCYSQHTPFGIIDRGCYNINYNLTTYVCSCNLCNHIPIKEMPFIFSNKHHWVDNVIELSRTRNLRNSVYKDMACLKCEVNATNKIQNHVFNNNCLEGLIGALPSEICQENEICAIKAIQNEGYVWRGCTKRPLYNYYWYFCDSDLCNYDKIVSLYDFT